MCSKLTRFYSLVIVLILAGSLPAVDPLNQDTGPDGIVCVEAENFDENTPQGAHTFELETAVAGYLGTGYMIGLPNSGAGPNPGEGPRLDYKVNFVTSGTHYLWMRCYAGTDPATGNNDSFHAGLNGTWDPGSDRFTGFGAAWEWTNDTMDPERATIEVPSAGPHTLNIWMREDGSAVDKIILTTNPNYTPTGNGPPESSRGPILIAYAPTPNDGNDIYLKRWATLGWVSGDTADSHDVYFGTDRAAVEAGTGGTFQKNQSGNLFVVGVAGYPLPTGLSPGTTYYWRIDEVEADGVTKHKGNVWSFGLPPGTAYSPNPPDGAYFVDPDITLTWDLGFDAVLHTVYFGDDYDTVANASGSPPQGPAWFEPPDTLEMNKTYYWRVDEQDLTGSLHIGDVWTFTTTREGLGSIVMERWANTTTANLDELKANPDFPSNPGETLVLTEFKFDGPDTDQYGARIYGWLYAPGTGDYTFWLATDDHGELWLSSDDDPQNATLISNVNGYSGVNEWNKYSSQQSAPIPLVAGNRYYVEAIWREGTGGDHCNVAWAGPGVGGLTPISGSYLSPFDPVEAYGPSPLNRAVDVKQDARLRWKPGKHATSHDVYFGTSQAAVATATKASPEFRGTKQIDAELYDPGLLQLATSYYWRVDESNSLHPDSPWQGSVWSFSTGDFLVIDDMEDYNNFAPYRIFETWIDGWGDSANGSQTGHLPTQAEIDAGATFAETGIVHSGDQSMPLYYDNNMKYSEATMTLPPHLRDWTQEGVKALSLWYQGVAPSLGSFTEGPAGTYNMTGAGEDIWGTSDQFHFAYKMLTGPGTITARVDNIIANDTDVWVKAGVMIRNSLDPNSMFAGLYMTSGSGCRFQARLDTAASAVSDSSVTTLAGVQVPHWIRLERTFTGEFHAYDSNDGVNWYPLVWNPVNIQMNSTVYIGLAITSHTPGLVATGVFSNVTTIGNVTGATFTNLDIGIQSNAPEQMYVSIKDAQGRTATVYNTDADAANVTTWTEWGDYGQGIALSEFTDKTPGLNLSNIDAISLGFGIKGNAQPGGTGVVYFDDIRLYRPVCVPELAKPAGDFSDNCVVDMLDLEIMTDEWLLAYLDPATVQGIVIEAEAADTITAPMEILSDDPNASGGQYVAVVPGNNDTGAPPADGRVTYNFTVPGGTYRIMARTIAPDGGSDSFWLQIQGATTQTTNDASGWVRWGLVSSEDWSWSSVRSMDDGDATVEFTMSAGTYPLEIAYREDGTLLDKLLITDDLDFDTRALNVPATDMTGDQKVDFQDYAALIDAWLDEVLWP